MYNDKVLLVDKVVELTSSDTINKLKRVIGVKKIGHSGTLDRLASGLLVVTTGKATKLSKYFLESDKAYSAEVQLGIETDTLDLDGDIIAKSEVTKSQLEHIGSIAESFVGTIEQTPPVYSALKIDGKRASDRIRNGEDVEIPARTVTIKQLQLTEVDTEAFRFRIEVECSKGTYIRSLVRDMGKKLGCGAVLSSLRRTASGMFKVQDAATVEEFSQGGKSGAVKEMGEVLSFMNEVFVDEAGEKRVSFGRFFLQESVTSSKVSDSEYTAIYNSSKKLIAIAKVNFKEWHVAYENVFA